MRVTVEGRTLILPLTPVGMMRRLMPRLPHAVRTWLVGIGPVRNLAGVMLIGRK